MAASTDSPDVSVIMSTYNRGELLSDAVRNVLAQRAATAPPFELIVVDNNSTDRTREIVARLARADGRVRYVFEPKQGLSCARNAGIREARGRFIAFTDDDVRADPGWVEAIVRAFDEHPEADAVGGRVLPLWPSAPPSWLTRDHWAPLALLDYGEAPIAITSRNVICLIGANVAFRRRVFEEVGDFETGLQRVKDSIGSLEDHEFLLRLLAAGRTGVYDPRMTLHAEIPANRLNRAYHRRWHAGHGHFHALLRSGHMERTVRGTFLGVPAHLFRQALGDIVGWAQTHAAGDEARSFLHEVRVRFFFGFLRTRGREFLDARGLGRIRTMRRVFRELLRRSGRRTRPAAAGARLGTE
jgi:glycosyltransferase involved in cell wall biosynthesis